MTGAYAAFGDNIYNNSRPKTLWTSLQKGDQNAFKYTLDGNYGSKRLLGEELVYINFHVAGDNIPNGDFVLNWL